MDRGRFGMMRDQLSIQEQPMITISIEEAQAKLPELIGSLAKGEELVIVKDDQVVARLVG